MRNLSLFRNNQPKSFFDIMDEFEKSFSKDLSGWNESWAGNKEMSHRPHTDIFEDDKNYILTFDIPGLKKEDIKIEFEDGLLTVWGERKSESNEDQNGVHRKERFYGKFSRSFSLPNTVKSENIAAKYEDGVLKVEIPKQEQTLKKTISVQ